MNSYTLIQNADNWVLRCGLCGRKIRTEYKSPVPSFDKQDKWFWQHVKLAKSGAYGKGNGDLH